MDLLKALKAEHSWKFKRIGGIYQVELSTVDDLKALETLDPKLWVALSCPVNGLEIDRETLTLIDFDADGRVRIEEMLAAVRWTLQRLANPESLFEGGELPLSAIHTGDAEGQALLASAKQILANVGDDTPDTISVKEAANTAKIYGQSKFNGDGIVAADATDSEELKQVIGEIMNCLGPETDRSGEPGISLQKLDTFFKELGSYEQWWTRGEVDSAEGADVFPLGDATPEAFNALVAIERKVDDFFARCRLAAFDPRAEAPLNHDMKLYERLATEDFSVSQTDIQELPLAKVSGSPLLPLGSGINPEWKARMDKFCKLVIGPLALGIDDSLAPEEWRKLRSRFGDYRKWREAKPDTGVEKLGIARVRELLTGNTHRQLNALLQEDLALAPKMQSVDAVEKLARMHRDLIRVLNNFVNFSDFYDEERAAIFQAGTLFLDGRECRLCLKVDDPNKHAALASLSRAFLTYCECRRKDSPSKFHIAAVFSAGDSANLIVGRNGVFRDGSGKLWDTTVVKIIQNPISIREAFLMPYVRVGRFIGDQLEKWASSRDKAIQKQLETGVQNIGKDSANDGKEAKGGLMGGNVTGIAGMIAAAGIALGAVGAGLASLFNTMKALSWWELPLVIFGLILMISLPSMFIAWLKIRQRTLAPLLDASGWAVNGKTLISFQLGRLLTLRATLPLDAHCKFDERHRVRKGLWIALGAAAFASAAGWAFLIL
ncbi:hypothetical protein [Coraliomargarita parva]|uniref:hypothetical protein n=1 Tax=Coraliomargarita parva TaxID=3014050 RepID=UPI0022B5311D|nr:hypothetical protein [Coraliomargarita parva]